MPLSDAHNHLQQFEDAGSILAASLSSGVTRMIVNGTCEEDWEEVAKLANQHPGTIVPAFGLHPWQVPDRSPDWESRLRDWLQRFPQSILGECGLDRWKEPFDLDDQTDCLRIQLQLALELQRPVTIHCLKAWGPLAEVLRSFASLPPFLVHAFSGSREMAAELAHMGAYFSFNGYFLHERKASVRETYQSLPADRLLLETDAPSMLPPEEYRAITLPDEQSHPANLTRFVTPLAELRGISREELISLLEKNLANYLGEA
ncbi:MAG: TatD family hydrolase [Verrucomicrobiota bacterium JB023]|nr:TatD family hydrolase [Verrucomicrobiota bacterium JB023]